MVENSFVQEHIVVDLSSDMGCKLVDQWENVGMRHESRQSGISFDVSMSWEPNHAVLLLELVLFL